MRLPRAPHSVLASVLVSTLVSALVATLLLTGLAAPARASRPHVLPPLPTSPAGDPPGANDWSCKPTKARPEPVVLVHGTFGDRKNLLENLSRSIKAAGFCVYSLDYGNRGTEEIAHSAGELSAFVQRVLHSTGASKVSLVGHSQGGMMPRYYIKFLGGGRYVDDLVGIAPSNHGTTVFGSGTNPVLAALCPACAEQQAGSAFLTRLDAGDETPGQVSYTVIESEDDEVVVPYTSAFLAAGPRTTNVTLQDVCPGLVADHVLIPTVKPTIDITLDALEHAGPASPSYRPACA